MDRQEKIASRMRRKKRIRKKISGSAEVPRLCVYKSLNHMYAQLIDDGQGKVITGLSTLNKQVTAEVKNDRERRSRKGAR